MKEDKKWKKLFYISLTILGGFLISGIAFKAGMIVAEQKCIINGRCKENIESFYSNSWSVYTTIFGVLGIVLGVVFPLIQASEQEKRSKEEREEIERELRALREESNRYKLLEHKRLIKEIIKWLKTGNLGEAIARDLLKEAGVNDNGINELIEEAQQEMNKNQLDGQ